jgi:hypothetical protein
MPATGRRKHRVMDHGWAIEHPAEAAYSRARWAALRRAVLAPLRRQQRTLLPYEHVRARFPIRGQRDLGLRTVSLSQIVGSQGRYGDFDREFGPRTARTADRWKSIYRARGRNVELPPIELYKLGDVYFVADGHHRVSVARHAGQLDIAARDRAADRRTSDARP